MNEELQNKVKEFLKWIFCKFDGYLSEEDWAMYQEIFPDAEIVHNVEGEDEEND